MALTSVEPVERSEIFGGVPLTVVFADGEALAAIREDGGERIALEPPFHVSDEDVYLVLPSDIGLELVDIFADADRELLGEAIDEGLLVLGSIEKSGPGSVVLEIEECMSARALLESGLPYAAEIVVGADTEPIAELNELERVTISSEMIDDEGLDCMLRSEEHVGTSWRVPAGAEHLRGVDPTHAWSVRLPNGRVGIEAVLFIEYEELVVLLRPAVLALEERPALRAV